MMGVWCAEVPKVELHLHLEGAIPLDALWALIEAHGGDVSVPTREALEARFAYRDFPSFIETWVWKNTFLSSYGAFEAISEAVARSLKAQNVVYVEAFCSPADFVRHGLKTQPLLRAIRAGLARVEGIDVRLVVDLIRDFGPEQGERVLGEVVEVADEVGVVGIGIGGSEQRFPPEPWARVYAAARDAGLKTSAHAGEAAGPESVWGALRTLKVDRIGHGTRAIEDPALVEHLAETQVHVELCPLSNVRTGVVADLASHPIRAYLDRGLNVSVNTDDPAMFHNPIVEEFEALQREAGVTRAELEAMTLAAVDAAWLDEASRAALRARVEAGWAAAR